MGAIPPHIAITYQQPMTQPLSPAAQAVLDAAVLPCTIREGIAAELEAHHG